MLIKFRHMYEQTIEVNSDKDIPDGLVDIIAKTEGIETARKQNRYKMYFDHGKCFQTSTVKANVEAAIRKFYMDGCPFYMPCRIRFEHEDK